MMGNVIYLVTVRTASENWSQIDNEKTRIVETDLKDLFRGFETNKPDDVIDVVVVNKGGELIRGGGSVIWSWK